MSVKPKHPGTITFVDGATHAEVRRARADELPETARYAPTEDGWVPVVKVVAQRSAERVEIKEYGPKGELLRTTIGRAGGER